MNLVYIHSGKLPSKAANGVHVMKMCRALANQGINVELVIPASRSNVLSNSKIFEYYHIEEELFSIRQIKSPLKSLNLPFFVLGIFFLMLTKKNIHVYGRSVFGCLLAAFLGKSTVYEAHAPVWQIDKMHKMAFRWLVKLRSFKQLVVISEQLKKLYVDRLSKDKIRVLHDAADPNFESTLPSTESLKNPTLGYVGGLYQGKGIETILDLAKLLPQTKFVIYGGDQHQIIEWENKLDTQNVEFRGYVRQDKIAEAFSSFDIGLLPNRKVVNTHNGGKVNISSYTSPLKLFEYMAHKRLILSSDFEVLREVIDDSTAFLLPSDQPKAWVSAVKEVMKSPIDAQNRIKSASHVFLTNYTWEARALQIRELY